MECVNDYMIGKGVVMRANREVWKIKYIYIYCPDSQNIAIRAETE